MANQIRVSKGPGLSPGTLDLLYLTWDLTWDLELDLSLTILSIYPISIVLLPTLDIKWDKLGGRMRHWGQPSRGWWRLWTAGLGGTQALRGNSHTQRKQRTQRTLKRRLNIWLILNIYKCHPIIPIILSQIKTYACKYIDVRGYLKNSKYTPVQYKDC